MAHEHTLLGTRISWTDGDIERTGEVWSAGPVVGTAWVIPDEPGEAEGHAVCVRVSRSKGNTVRPIDRTRSSAGVQRIGLGCLQLRQTLPIELFPGPDRLGSYGYHLPRGA